MNVNELPHAQDDENISGKSISSEDKSGSGHPADIIQLVSFTLDDVEYGIDILKVHEILRITDITRLPNAPRFIKGVINLRGNVIPVVDVRYRFGFPAMTITDFTRIVVVDTEGKQFGLFVDNVSQVIRISEQDIDHPSDMIEGVSDVFISGVGRLKDKLIVILNLDNILFEKDVEKAVS